MIRKLKSQVIEQMVHKVELGVDSVKVHYFVGQSQITRGLGEKLNSRDFFVSDSSNSLTNGASGENRTPTLLPEPDFESGASTNSATEALKNSILKNYLFNFQSLAFSSQIFHLYLSPSSWLLPINYFLS